MVHNFYIVPFLLCVCMASAIRKFGEGFLISICQTLLKQKHTFDDNLRADGHA